jgi:hypothetical protein
MSVEALSIVLHHSKARGTAKLVLLGIANHHGDGGAWPSVDTLARYANTTERSVQRALDTLVGTGELERFVQGGGLADWDDYTRPNRYVVRVTCPPWCDRTMAHRDTRKRSGRQARLPVAGPVDKPGDASVTRSPKQGEGVTPVSPGGVTPVSPKPSLVTGRDEVPASTTDRAREAEPVEPPALDDLRARLRDQTAEFRNREAGQP